MKKEKPKLIEQILKETKADPTIAFDTLNDLSQKHLTKLLKVIEGL
jgi:hypothetical protein